MEGWRGAELLVFLPWGGYSYSEYDRVLGTRTGTRSGIAREGDGVGAEMVLGKQRGERKGWGKVKGRDVENRRVSHRDCSAVKGCTKGLVSTLK